MSEELNELIEMSKTARKFCNRFLLTCLSGSKGRTVNELFWVPLILISRILRTQEAIELLLKEGYLAEGAIIALTQFELRLDIFYIDVNIRRATQWVEHESEKHHPWKVKDKIEEIYDINPKKKDAQQRIFQMLSAVKHGNPVAGGFGFSVRSDGKILSGTTGEVNDSLALSYKIAVCGFCIYQLLESLEGVSRAFSKFIKINGNLQEELIHLLQKSKRKMVKIMHHIGVIDNSSSIKDN